MGDYWNKIRYLPMDEVFDRGVRLIKRKSRAFYQSKKARYFSTYSNKVGKKIYSPLPVLKISDLPYDEKCLAVAERNLCHEFDLLGSGWCSLYIGMQANGLGGVCYKPISFTAGRIEHHLKEYVTETNMPYAKKICKMMDKDYNPLPWHMDFKSGYCWSASLWYTDVLYGQLRGVDVKVPWELSRMQHLPLFAYSYAVSEIDKRDAYWLEYRNEILDFIAHNPPKFGVNWSCTMDVGIRIANWLVAYDLFNSFGVDVDEEFEQVLTNSVYDHGKHILDNLEYQPHLRSNHYLSDIAGLLFAALHLDTEETDGWLLYALQELISEMEHEFHEDGSNFEGSTSYHRLSTEIMLYAALFALQIPEERKKRLKRWKGRINVPVGPKLRPFVDQYFSLDDKKIFPMWYWERLARSLRFTVNLLRHNGSVPQIGDNDSGRFLKISPVYIFEKVGVLEEDILNHTHLASIYDILFLGGKGKADFEALFVKTLSENVPRVLLPGNSICSDDKIDVAIKKLQLDNLTMHEYNFISQNNLHEEMELYAYNGMGLYIYRGKNFYLTARCGEVGQKGNGGHSHNDQLSVTLQIDEKDIISDPGTYLYTPIPEERNRFRSTRAHFTPQFKGIEQNTWLEGAGGLFSILEEKTKAQVLHCSKDGILMVHYGFGTPVYRAVFIETNAIVVRDWGAGITTSETFEEFSSGYGKIKVLS